MSTYPNGKIPAHLLIRRGDFLLTAGTWAKFDDLVARVKRRTGVTLRISTGSIPATRGAGAFRTYNMQVLVKAYWTLRGKSRMAASPGTSSHGGEWKGVDALAIDISNYADIPLAVFFEEARAAGFQVGYFDGKNGRPYEPWHIIDRDPYRKLPAPTAKPSVKPKPKPNPAPTKPETPEEEYEMNPIYIYNRDHYDRVYVVHPLTGKKRALPKAEWEAAKLNGARYYVATKAQTDEIPNA